jgi:hypothetical protein
MTYVITNYLDIANSAALPTDIWFADNSTDSGNNTGWNISANDLIFGNYLYIIDSAATPANTWYALDSTDAGNNTGWIFVLPPVSSGQQYPISLRSFTEHRRF